MIKKILSGITTGVVSAAIALLLGFLDFSENLELLSLDLRYKALPQIEMSKNLGFIDFDDSSLELFGKWPWPRARQVELVKTLNYYNARAVGYDVFFIEKEEAVFSSNSLKEYLSQKQKEGVNNSFNHDEVVKKIFRHYDRELAQSIEKSGIIYLPYFGTLVQDKGQEEILKLTMENLKNFSELKREAVREVEKSFLEPPAQGKNMGSNLYY